VLREGKREIQGGDSVKKRPFTLRMSPVLISFLDERAKEEKTSRTAIIEKAVDQYIRDRFSQDKHQPSLRSY